MADLDALRRWLERYAVAWRSNDAETIGALFTDDAVYRWHPYDEGDAVARGREAIVHAWLEEPDDPGSWEFTAEPLAITDGLGVARAVTTYTEDGIAYHNIFLVRLEDDGRCSDFVEYFMKAP
ncbi:MAG TPA: nuclear transport factor 2 family protein [Gaiellaceae bacterium]